MSNSPNIRYQPLSQTTPSDDEDEGFDDNILYDSRLVKGPSMDRRNVFELERLGQPRMSSPPSVQYLGRGRRTCVLVTVLLVILLGAAAAVVFPILNHAYNHGVVTDVHSGKSSDDWTRVFNNSWTESYVGMMDVDGDGLDDIVIGLADQDKIEAALKQKTFKTMKEYCLSEVGQYPCGSTITAFRGYNGEILWQTPTRSVVIYQNCVDIDVDGDGHTDCIVTGRHSTCQAVDVRTGKILWVTDADAPKWSSHFVPQWNIYHAITLPDLDSDGVFDLLISHGGDKSKEPQDRNRRPGRLILLSGKTGLPIGEGYLELPENEETYMPTVKYITKDQAIYILFGSGGETIPGKLMAISLPDLHKSITNKEMTSVDLSLYTWLDDRRKDDNGVAHLYSGNTKGVMTPPVLVDIDNDDYTDILVSTFDGTVALLDGKTLQEKWKRDFSGMETYSIPAPGYYDADSILDFTIHLNEGVWDKYNTSKTMILSGSDGSTLWEIQAGSYSYSSDLSLRTIEDDMSVFLMKLVGLNGTSEYLKAPVGIDIMRRHLGEEGDSAAGSFLPDLSNIDDVNSFKNICADISQQVARDHVTCDRDLSPHTQEIFLMDRKIPGRPLKILERKAFRHHYQLHHKPESFHCHPLFSWQKDKLDMCTVLVPTSYTGAIGDVDDDGSLDYIHITQMIGSNRSDTFDVTGSISNVILSKHSLNAAISKADYGHLELSVNAVPKSAQDNYLSHLGSLDFLPSSLQAWTQYLGSRGSSWYYVPP